MTEWETGGWEQVPCDWCQKTGVPLFKGTALILGDQVCEDCLRQNEVEDE